MLSDLLIPFDLCLTIKPLTKPLTKLDQDNIVNHSPLKSYIESGVAHSSNNSMQDN